MTFTIRINYEVENMGQIIPVSIGHQLLYKAHPCKTTFHNPNFELCDIIAIDLQTHPHHANRKHNTRGLRVATMSAHVAFQLPLLTRRNIIHPRQKKLEGYLNRLQGFNKASRGRKLSNKIISSIWRSISVPGSVEENRQRRGTPSPPVLE